MEHLELANKPSKTYEVANRNLMKRRNFIAGSLVLGSCGWASSQLPSLGQSKPQPQKFWPDGIRLPISLSLMFEAGGQPKENTPTPFNNYVPPSPYPDLPTITWYRYGYTEGIPRLLNMLDRKKVKITSHMTGEAITRHPKVAKEIVARGHEPAAHGMYWQPQYNLTYDQEFKFISDNVDIIKSVTGKRPVGYNAPGLRGTVNTLAILQKLGFTYHIDDVSRDEPFIVQLGTKPFVVVPYAVYSNDIRAYESRNSSQADFLSNLVNEFDALYAESLTAKRLMVMTTHDRLLQPGRAKVIEDFITYAQSKSGVTFVQKQQLAQWTLDSPTSIIENPAELYNGLKITTN